MPIEPSTAYEDPETGAPWILIDVMGGEAYLVSEDGDERFVSEDEFASWLWLG